ncbi:MAG: hypothetical protein J6W75_06135 [Bacteroidaceae bacterium]|nr:hypothetical protein [Bacteroidaceae bacterium]
MRRAIPMLLLTAIVQMIAAQTAYNYRYWWDNATAVQTGAAKSATFDWTLDAKDFTAGLHMLHVQVQEVDGLWAPPVTTVFFKLTALTEFDKAWYWIDQGSSTTISAPTDGAFELDLSTLSVGLHTLHYQAVNKAGDKSPVTTTVFFKLSASTELDKAWYWIDQQEGEAISAPADGAFELDLSTLSVGLHTLHYQAVNKAGDKSPVMTTVFFKLSSSTELDKAWYWIDQQEGEAISAPTDGAFELDLSTLSVGLHTLHYQAVNKAGDKSPITSTVFYKTSSESSLKTAYYWIDKADTDKKANTAGETFEVDIAGLAPGIHYFHYQAENETGELSPIATDLFIVEHSSEGVNVKFWIDDDMENVRMLQMGKNEVVLDVSEMEVGDHTIFLSIVDKTNLPLAVYSQLFQVYDLSRMGDVNADDEVDVADIVLTVSHIIGKNPTNFIRLRADINQDGNVTVEDIVGIIRIIGGVAENGTAAVKAFHVDADDVLTASMHDRLLSIGLMGEQRYTAFQLTLTLPEGTDVEEAAIALNRRASHRVAFGDAEQGRVTIVAYAVDGAVFLGESGSLLQVLTSALPDGDITVDNIIFVTPEGGTRRFESFVIESPTGIHQASGQQTADGPVYDLAGRRLGKRPQRAGVYIQNGKKMTVK